MILILGQKITDRFGHKVTVEVPEYYGLACVVTDEMAEIALKMKVRKPMTLDQVAKATGKSKAYLEPLLTEEEQAVLRRLVRSYLLIALGAMLVLLGIAAAASRWVTRPVEKAWKQQRQFLSDASHELKTPLTVILSNAELLEGAGLAEKPARWSGNIHTEAEQMRTLVEQMLTLARADNGVRPAAIEPLNLSDVATDCVLAFEPVAFEAGKPLEERITADITVVGDADQLRRLISILLDNAVKYGAEGGHITLTLEKMDRQARLTVSNPGDPIPPEHLAHLFERFYRADASRGEKSGFGLGLAIADTIAWEHKGALKAESDTASTRFTFTMPLRKQA